MTSPAVGSLWIDNDPRILSTRYARIDGFSPCLPSLVFCTTWYDNTGGVATARRGVRMKVARFQPLANGSWSKTGFRPADIEPRLGKPSPA